MSLPLENLDHRSSVERTDQCALGDTNASQQLCSYSCVHGNINSSSSTYDNLQLLFKFSHAPSKSLVYHFLAILEGAVYGKKIYGLQSISDLREGS